MISETSLAPTRDDGLIRQRLRVEAALQHQGVPVRFHAGQLWIPLTERAMPIVIQRSASGGFRVEFQLTLGMCEATDGDLQQFVAAVNADRQSPILEVRENGATELFWAGEFAQTVNTEAVVRGVVELAEASTPVATELRERFFVAPPAVLTPAEEEEQS
jgi:hypothetical protein